MNLSAIFIKSKSMIIILLDFSLMMAACLLSQVDSPLVGKAKPQISQLTLEALHGEYYEGDGLGGNQTLVLESDGKFSYKSFADVGYRHSCSGMIRIDAGTLTFKVENLEPPAGQAPFQLPGLRPVRWGKRIYLIRESQIKKFCNAVNLGLEPRETCHGDFYVRIIQTPRSRRGDDLPEIYGRVDGVPELPIAWRPFLLVRPLHGEIIEVLNQGRATVDIGSDQGLQVGMCMMVEGKEQEAGPINRHYGVVKVVSIRSHRCIVEFVDPQFAPEFKSGQKVSSKITKRILAEGRSFIRY